MPRSPHVRAVLLCCALCVSGTWAARHTRSFSNSGANEEIINKYGDTRNDKAAVAAESWEEVFDAYEMDIDDYVDVAEDMVDDYDEMVLKLFDDYDAYDAYVDAAEDMVDEYDYDEDLEKYAETYADRVNGAMDEYVDEYMRYLDDQMGR